MGVQSQSDTIARRARVVRNNHDWGKAQQPVIPIEDTIIYELHVRGLPNPILREFHAKDFAGILQKLSYLKNLELQLLSFCQYLNLMKWQDTEKLTGVNFVITGDIILSVFAPNTSYTYEKEYNREGTELKELIKF